MTKFTCLVLCVVAASISRVYAGEAFWKATKPIVVECSKEYGTSIDELKSAEATGSIDGINSCFLGCIYKKAGILNSKGDFDLFTALIKLKEFVSNDEDFARLADVGKKCASVTKKPVSDGEAGCERASLLTACALKHKAEIPI